jgi:hypothetical protein
MNDRKFEIKYEPALCGLDFLRAIQEILGIEDGISQVVLECDICGVPKISVRIHPGKTKTKAILDVLRQEREALKVIKTDSPVIKDRDA